MQGFLVVVTVMLVMWVHYLLSSLSVLVVVLPLDLELLVMAMLGNYVFRYLQSYFM